MHRLHPALSIPLIVALSLAALGIAAAQPGDWLLSLIAGTCAFIAYQLGAGLHTRWTQDY